MTFQPGDTSVIRRVTVFDDNLSETNEAFSMELFNPINIDISTSSAVGTIIDND